MLKSERVRPDTDEGEVARYLLIILVAVISILIFLPLGFLVFRWADHPVFLGDIFERTVLEAVRFQPESGERTTFIFSLFYFPTSVFLILKFFGRDLEVRLATSQFRHLVDFGMAFLFVAFFIISILSGSLFPPNSVRDRSAAYELYGEILAQQVNFVVFILLSGGIVALWNLRSPSIQKALWRFSWIICGALVVLVGLVCIYTMNDRVLGEDHIHATIFPISQVVTGKTLLVDLTAQYGLYPHFLEPIFRLIGISVFKITVILSLLVVLSFSLILLVCRRLVQDPIVLALGFFAMMFFHYFQMKALWLPHLGSLDPGYQYWPARTLFPALFLLLASHYIRKPSLRLYWVLFGVSSIACLWNLDSGLPVFGTWLGLLLFQAGREFNFRKGGSYLLHAGLSALTTAAIYILFVYIRSGQFPSFANHLTYQKLYYIYGFAMIPMPVFSPWNWIALIYVTGIVFALFHWVRGSKGADSEKAQLIWILSILGAGLFSYYQGRSHDYNISTPVYPAFMILIGFLDSVLRTKFWRSKALLLVTSFVLLWFCLLASALVSESPAFLSAAWPFRQLDSKVGTSISDVEVPFVRENTVPNEEVLMLSSFSALWHIESHTASVVQDGFFTIHFIEEYERILNVVESKKARKIFLGSDFSVDRRVPVRARERRERIVEALVRNYRPEKQSASGNLVLFSPK